MPLPLLPFKVARCSLLSLLLLRVALAGATAAVVTAFKTHVISPRTSRCCSCNDRTHRSRPYSATKRAAARNQHARSFIHCRLSRYQTIVLSSASTDDRQGPIGRGRAIGIGLSGLIAGLALAPRPSHALNPIKKSQELLRIWGQEEADNVLGGGELASPEGGKTIEPVLTLIPIVTLRLQLDEVGYDLQDPSRFGDALAILQTQEFQKKDIKRVFNAYSDNIYYLPDSERENKYLQGGASPSTRQTLQYLIRNDVLENIEALTAEVAYLIGERETIDSSDGDGDASEADLDEKDLKMYFGKCKSEFDKYLGMVFQNEIDQATEYAKVALNAKKKATSTATKR